jgi:uncharacterized SAM-binding protein YcdF (DUF218 family)
VAKVGQSIVIPPRNLLSRIAGIIRTIVAASGALLIVVTFTPLDLWWATWLAGRWDDPKGEVLIVLGGSVVDDGMIGASTYWRAVYAVRAWRQGGFKAVVFSGGGTGSGSAAEAMRDFLISQGVPREVIWTETRSESTRENALFTKPILDSMPGRKVLLTSDFHTYRASRAFKKVGLDVVSRPLPDVRKRAQSIFGRWGAFLDLSEETAKIIGYYVRGWI